MTTLTPQKRILNIDQEDFTEGIASYLPHHYLQHQRSQKHLAKQASLVACLQTAKQLFAESDQIKRLQDEIAKLQQQLQQKELVHTH